MDTRAVEQVAKTDKKAQPFLGLYVIVRDAEKTIGALLESVRGAFDEVVVVDTGSEDRTREVVKSFFDYPLFPFQGEGVVTARPWGCQDDGSNNLPRLVFASFRWIDDFAAARNYAFSLGTAKWRMYLDADDIYPDAKQLREWIRASEQSQPQVNCHVLPYEYDPTCVQDKHRIFRWADGWEWRDELHEHCDPIGHPRMLSVSKGTAVKHSQPDQARSATRNARIATAVLERALAVGDTRKAGIFSYYVAMHHLALGLELATDGADVAEHLGTAQQCLERCVSLMPFSNFAALSCFWAGYLAIKSGNPDAAALMGSQALAHAPELPEGWLVLAVAQNMRGEHGRAALCFDAGFAGPSGNPFRTANELDFNEGEARIAAAESYLAVGRMDDAVKSLNSIAPARAQKFRATFSAVQVKIMKKKGLDVLRSYVEYLCWDTQPLLARDVLSWYVPAAIEDMPEVAVLRRQLEAKIPQAPTEGNQTARFRAYEAVYAGIPDGTEDPGNLLKIGRAKAAVAWAKNAVTTYKRRREFATPPGNTCVLSVGALNCIIERAILEANPGLFVTVVDVSDQVGPSYAKLLADFPGRVDRHVMRGLTDWCPSGKHGYYDAAICFEVIEHLPRPDHGLEALRLALRSDGMLLLSTPVADRWVEPHLTGPEGPGIPKHEIYWHLNAWNPTQLETLLREAGLYGRLESTDGGAVYLARRGLNAPDRSRDTSDDAYDVAIHVAATPHPFDPDTPTHKHLGGSEEAVIYLSEALARKGCSVTIYSPRAVRSDDVVVHAHAGVMWRDVTEFDPEGDVHDAVMFWRAPQSLLDPRVRAAPYAKILWLHDTHYGASKACYEAADAVVLLSEFHAKVMAEKEEIPVSFRGHAVAGLHEPHVANFELGANGIDPAAFPFLTDENEAQRDPLKVVYGSSPDRGLQYLLAAWPAVRLVVPEATLDVYYTWGLYEAVRPVDAAKLRELAESLANHGVTLKGGVSHDVLHAAYRRASVWAYPTDFEEISCITAMKALASGLTPVTTGFAALHETLGPWCDHDQNAYEIATTDGIMAFQNRLIHALLNPASAYIRRERQAWALKTHSWDAAAEKFVNVVATAVAGRSTSAEKVVAS